MKGRQKTDVAAGEEHGLRPRGGQRLLDEDMKTNRTKVAEALLTTRLMNRCCGRARRRQRLRFAIKTCWLNRNVANGERRTVTRLPNTRRRLKVPAQQMEEC